MHHCNYNFDQVEWRRIVDESCKDYKIDFKYSLLGYDLKLKRLDMLLKYAPGNSHCRRHRHGFINYDNSSRRRTTSYRISDKWHYKENS